MNAVLFNSDVPELRLIGRGKVRDIYDLDDALLIVATDRISCFDVVLPTPIPHKGVVLAQMSRFWFQQTRSIVRNHFLTMDLENAVGRFVRELRQSNGDRHGIRAEIGKLGNWETTNGVTDTILRFRQGRKAGGRET